VLGEAARYIPLGCDAIQTTGVAIDDNGANILIAERLNDPTDGLIAANRYDDVSSATKDVGYLHDALPSLAISLASGLVAFARSRLHADYFSDREEKVTFPDA
jgi:hypothetical protein